ncbi:hypothetical protein [Streptomyces antimicrobicus]|uniref:DUF559 domain-containing protein n=1 Tax=Streptomyces antimicrobicus TaxID=2883108 RepID=A0ABS8B4V5_9ACTN|nr:hypothetical protein [Streptomyces antimicrobicus]MCB5179644.1 hypothetical protein [Streptomyces antimicrobicus]
MPPPPLRQRPRVADLHPNKASPRHPRSLGHPGHLSPPHQPRRPVQPPTAPSPEAGRHPTAAAHRQLNLATYRQLRQAGVASGTISNRCRPGGPWQRLLPRVHLLQTGPPDHRQRALAAVLYAADPAGGDPLSGTTAALTGGAALALLGVRGAPVAPYDVLIRAPRRLRPVADVLPRPTTRWPGTMSVTGIPCARPLRAAVDFAARAADPALVRSVLANTVQSGWCHPADLHAELRTARLLPRPAVRTAAAELVAGVRSIAEAHAREALAAAQLPTPLWNARLYTPDGAFLATPDAYWPDEGVALEIDSAEYHFTRDSWHATLRRRLRLEAHGILVVSATPSMIRDTPQHITQALEALLTLTTHRPTPPTALARGHQQLPLPLPLPSEHSGELGMMRAWRRPRAPSHSALPTE